MLFALKPKTPLYDPAKWEKNPEDPLVRLSSTDRDIPSVQGLLGIFLDRLDLSLLIESPPEKRHRALGLVVRIKMVEFFTGVDELTLSGSLFHNSGRSDRGRYPINDAPDGIWEYSQRYLDLVVDMLDLATLDENSTFHRDTYEDYDDRGDAMRDAARSALHATVYTHQVIAGYLHGKGEKGSKFGSAQALDLTRDVMERAIPVFARAPEYTEPVNFTLPYLPPSLAANVLRVA